MAFNLKSLESLLPPAQPLADRLFAFKCLACGSKMTIDARLRNHRFATVGQRFGLVKLACKTCGSADLSIVGLIVS